MSCFIKQYEVIWHEATACRHFITPTLWNDNWIHCFLCFCDVGLTAFFGNMGRNLYGRERVHFSSLLNAAIFSSLRPSRQFWRSFESCIIYNSDFDETLLERFVWIRPFHVVGALRSPPCALSHWPYLSSIHHSTNGNARREPHFHSPLWIPLEVRTHNRAFFKPLTLPL